VGEGTTNILRSTFSLFCVVEKWEIPSYHGTELPRIKGQSSDFEEGYCCTSFDLSFSIR
jgi:hypothetical protein